MKKPLSYFCSLNLRNFLGIHVHNKHIFEHCFFPKKTICNLCNLIFLFVKYDLSFTGEVSTYDFVGVETVRVDLFGATLAPSG